jgi:hypothetical protein
MQSAVKRPLDSRLPIVVAQASPKRHETSFADAKTSDENDNESGHALSAVGHPSASVPLLLSPSYPGLSYDLDDTFPNDMRSELATTHPHLHTYSRIPDIRSMAEQVSIL